MANDIIDNIAVQLTLQDKMSKGMKEARKTIGKETQKIKRSFSKSNTSILRTQNLLKGLGTAAVLGGLNKLSNAAERFEFGLVGVGKTTDIVGERLQALGSEIQTLSFQIPVMTNQMLNIATVAGQLGVKGTNDILAFTSAVSKLRLTTDLVDESFASASLARILTVTNTDLSQVENFASAIVKLGNNSAATESEILNVATRVAQTTAAFNTTADDVAAMSATLREFGERAEAGGSAIGIFFRKMNRAIRLGGKEFEILNRVTGKSQKELLATLEENSTDAFVAILEGLKSLDAVGVEKFFDDMKINTNEVNRVIVPFIKNLDRLKEKLDLSRVEFIDPTELDREMEQFSKTFFARMTIFKNSMTAVMVDVGQVINDNIMPALERIGNWVQQNHKSIANAITSMFKPMIAFVGILTTSKLVATLAKSFGKITKSAKGLKIMLMGLNPTIAIITGIGVAIAGVTKALSWLSKKTKSDGETFKESWLNAFNEIQEATSNATKIMTEDLESVSESLKGLIERLTGQEVVSWMETINDVLVTKAVSEYTQAILLLTGSWELLKTAGKSASQVLLNLDSPVVALTNINKLVKELRDNLNSIAGSGIQGQDAGRDIMSGGMFSAEGMSTALRVIGLLGEMVPAGQKAQKSIADVGFAFEGLTDFNEKIKELRQQTSFLNGEYSTTDEKLFKILQNFNLLNPQTAIQIAMVKHLTSAFKDLTDAEQIQIDKQDMLESIGERFATGLEKQAERLERIKQIHQEALSPLELYRQKVAELQDLFGDDTSSATFTRTMERYREELKKSQEETSAFSDLFNESFKRVGDGIAQVLLAGENSLDTFKNFFKAFAADLIQQAFRLLVVERILNKIAQARANTGGSKEANAFSAAVGLFGSFAGGRSSAPSTSVPSFGSSSSSGGASGGGNMAGGGTVVNIDLRGSNGDESIKQAVTQGINEATPSIIQSAEIRTTTNILNLNQRRPNIFGRA